MMIDKRCAICGVRVSSATPRSYFCWKCYNEYNDDIKNNREWIIYLKNLENKRRWLARKFAERGISIIYLGDKWDIDNDRNLVHRDGYNG